MMEYKPIQYVCAKHRGIYNELKSRGLNKINNLFFTGSFANANPPIIWSGVFMITPDGTMSLLQASGPGRSFMTPIIYPQPLCEAIEAARVAVRDKHGYILPTLNAIERAFGLPETELPSISIEMTTQNDVTPLF